MIPKDKINIIFYVFTWKFFITLNMQYTYIVGKYIIYLHKL